MAGAVFADATNCVILEKDGNRALTSCDGGSPQNVDLGGRADAYKVGDSVSVPGTTEERETKDQAIVNVPSAPHGASLSRPR
jgi:hypothetical protein